MKQFFSFSKLPTAIIFAGMLFFASCKKNNNTNATDNPDPALSVDAAQNDATAEEQFDDVFNISMAVQSSDAGQDIGLETGTNILYKTFDADRVATPEPPSRCYTVTVVPKGINLFPKTVTLDFGNGCTGKDGKVRSGKIITVFSGPMRNAGSKATTTFMDYNVDSFMVEGTHTIENTSTSNKMAWTVSVSDGKITNTESGKWIKWDAVHEHIQTEGNGTSFNPLDDVFKITGNSNGSNSNGNSWTTIISQPLIRKFICPWRESGEIAITRKSNTVTAVLDYGDGTCDNKATVTIGGITKTITL
jgi:hypothetical protein